MTDQEPVDLQGLLDTPMSDFPDRPDLPPRATFFGKLTSVEAIRSKEKQTPALTFHVRPVDPGPAVPSKWLEATRGAGFDLSDYDITADFWLTPNSMVMLRRFLNSLGFDPNATFRESLKLDQYGNPTQETQELIRGLDVIVQTPDKFNDRVFNRADSIVGKKT